MSKTKIIFLLMPLLVITTAGMALAQEAANTATTVDQQTVQTMAQDEDITAQDLGVSDPTLLSEGEGSGGGSISSTSVNQ